LDAPGGTEPAGEAPHAPYTVGEALAAYWHCLLCGPPPKKDEAPKKDNSGGSVNGADKAKQDNGNKDNNPDSTKDNGDDKEKDKEPELTWFSAHGQATVVTQAHSNFNPPYTGTNSLLPNEKMATSITATLFLDARLWEGGELIFNPEVAGGSGFSNTLGIAGFPNQEITRVGVIEPTFYLARLYFQQTFGLGGEKEKVEDGPNEIAGQRDINRITIKAGKLPATDIADDNRYAHDSRYQFLDWALVYNGAWDYPANVRGYTFGAAIEFNTKWWTLSYGAFAVSTVANGAALDPNIINANGHVLELEQRYELDDHPGKLRWLAYLNHAHMGNYRLALAEMPVNPDVTLTRAYRLRYGFGLNWEQELTKDLGVFARLGWNNGQAETWEFTEIDETASLGLVLKGTCWCRPKDEIGVAGLINGISDAHRDYLAAGGLGFIIGDGRLNYGLEEIFETYYNFVIMKGINFAVAFQEVNHPAYNRDRGPVSIGTMRLHFEF
jgi:high affinity Mn2+ porin